MKTIKEVLESYTNKIFLAKGSIVIMNPDEPDIQRVYKDNVDKGELTLLNELVGKENHIPANYLWDRRLMDNKEEWMTLTVDYNILLKTAITEL